MRSTRRSSLLRRCLALLRDDAYAQNATQDVFVALLRNHDRLTDEAPAALLLRGAHANGTQISVRSSAGGVLSGELIYSSKQGWSRNCSPLRGSQSPKIAS